VWIDVGVGIEKAIEDVKRRNHNLLASRLLRMGVEPVSDSITKASFHPLVNPMTKPATKVAKNCRKRPSFSPIP